MLGYREEGESKMSCFGDGIGSMTLDDWLTLSCSLHLAMNKEKYPLRGGDDVFGGLGLCRGGTMGRGLG